ncbi:MAG: 3'-5' exonuclease, partial [Erysipelotrichaceae bacterium]
QLSLAGVLLSPLFNLSENDLAKLRLKDKYSLKRALEQDSKVIYDQIQSLISSSSELSLVQFLNKAYATNDYYFSACDTQLRTNLDFLKAKAEDFDANCMGLLEFVEMIDMVKDEETSEAIPISEDDDVVKVMTIHQAKGLEWPVVFVLSNSEDKDHNSGGGNLYFHPDIGIGLSSIILPNRYIYENPISLSIKHRNKVESKAEALRTLYVALTRAKSRLIVVDYDRDNFSTKKLDLNLLNSPKGNIYWIMAALKDYQDNDIKYISAAEIKNNNIDVIYKPKQFNFTPQASNPLEWKTPSSAHPKLPYFNLKPIDLFSGKERGTRLHSLMELLPFSNWTHGLIQSIDPLCTNEEIEELMAFYNSSWYQTKLDKVIEKEFPFTYLKANQVVHGIMDMLIYDDTDVYLMDYKTDVNLNEKELLDNYKEQLDEYALALKAIFPKHTIHCSLFSFKFKKVLDY